VAPRLSARVTVRFEVELGENTTVSMSQTENVSIGGMLVRSHRKFPVETKLRFELVLPDEAAPVRGLGLVVRHTEPRPGKALGIGVKFLEVEDDGDARLRAYLSEFINGE
jgi:uncharacterized protein (TIGR02266 family)